MGRRLARADRQAADFADRRNGAARAPAIVFFKELCFSARAAARLSLKQ